jgi:uncharacterized protein (TIGR03000 family)
MLLRHVPWLLGMFILASVPCVAIGQATPPPADKALIVIRLPADAKLTISGEPTRQTGPERTFITPSLQAGKRYRYRLAATWIGDGKQRKTEFVVRFKAGDRVLVDLNKEAGKQPARTKDKDGPKDLLPAPKVEKPGDRDVSTRTFEFTYAATITDLEAGKKVKVWVPVATSSDAQDVKLLSSEVKSGDEKARGTIHAGKSFGNRFFFVETTPDDQGKISLKLVYWVTRREVKGQTTVNEDMGQLARLLQPDTLVPTTGKPLRLIEDRDLPDDPMKKARVLYDVVNEHMTYSKKGTGWGRGDSAWACDSKYGNCSDFHSLFISLARAQKMPAKFEIGFPLPRARGEGKIEGYHCWAFFRPEGNGWVPVDISEANKDPRYKDYYFGNLTPDRVTFSTGRDIELVPKQAGKPVNFLVYPYVEVEGKEYPQAKIEKRFAYKDLR